MIMAASCFATPLSSSSSRSSSNAIPKCKTLIPSFSHLKASTTSFHLSFLSRHCVAQRLQIKVSSSSELSVLEEEKVVEEEEEVEVDGETGEETEAEPVVMKKPRPCELYVCNIPRSYDIAQLLEMFQPFGTVISVEVRRINLTSSYPPHTCLFVSVSWLK